MTTTGLRFLAAICVLSLSSCSGLRQFPKIPTSPQSLQQLDPELHAAISKIHSFESGTPTTPERQKAIRNHFIEIRMALIDSNFRTFETQLMREGVGAELGVSLLSVGAGAAGALVTETTSQLLSAVSGGLTGGYAAYGKAALYEKAISSLLAQMRASRKVIAAQILQRWALRIEDYPLWMARFDLDAYYFAGSIPGAIAATASDARVKEASADQVILREIGLESVGEEVIAARETLVESVDSLSADAAKTLVGQIEGDFLEIAPFVEVQYPMADRGADMDGSKAKTVLKRMIVLTVRSMLDAARWRMAVEGSGRTP